MTNSLHSALAPSPWVQRWSHLVAPGATVLDVACGSGRHLRWFAERGCRVTGIDRDAVALEPLATIAETVVADIEGGPWPLAGRRFDAVIVTNYLWRPLMPTLIASIDEGGVLLYETFAHGNATVGKPSNPNFLLQPRELLQAVQEPPSRFAPAPEGRGPAWGGPAQDRGLRVIAYEDGFLAAPERFVQRIAAVREAPRSADPVRYPL